MSLPDFTNIFQVVFGIGLVIFVHELGHFLAARWCGARVEVFSLGFGPRLVGWQRGDTLFQIAAVPLGGFVKVAGEYHDGTTAKEPGTLSALNVPQRFLYYSGGVIMNVIFALVVLPLVMFAGMPARQPVVGVPEPGLAAWEAGVPAQSRVLSVNGEPIIDFQHLITAIAVNGKNPITLVVEPPGSAVSETYTLEPTYDEDDGVYRLGLPLGIDPDLTLIVSPDSPAAAAGLTSEDALVRVLGQPAGLRIERQLVRALMAGGPVGLEVRGPDGSLRTVEVAPRTEPLGVERIGVGAVPNRVTAVRTGGVANSLVLALGIQVDDVLLSIEGRDVFSLDTVEDGLARANADGRLDAIVLRSGEPLALSAPLGADEDAMRLLEDVALVTNENTTFVSITPDSAASAAGLVDGDRVLVVDGRAVSTWDEMLEAIRAGIERGRPLELVVEHAAAGVTLAERYAGAPTENLAVTLRGAPVEVPFYGVNLSAASMTLKAAGMGEAISMGTRLTKRFLIDVWLQLKKMIFSDEISTKNLGGIISISVISYDTASQGLSKLFFFLALLSINLAIINLLPIPILDGGHLLFLLIEAVKGSPVSERTFGYSQVVGLVMIMSLMVYVTYQDIVRWLLPG